MKLELKKPAYKNMKLVKIYYGNDNPAQSRQATVSMLQAYPNLKGIESPTTVGISSAAQYLSTSKYKKQGRAHGSRPAEPDEEVRAQRHGEGVRSSGTRRISGTSRATRSPRSPTARSRARSARRSRPASSATYVIIKGPDGKPQVVLGPPYTFTIKNVDKFKF